MSNESNVYDPAQSLVHTAIGEVPESDLDIVYEQANSDDTWIIARVSVYKGAAHPDKIGEIVRRDVWVTVKRGQGITGTMGGQAPADVEASQPQG